MQQSAIGARVYHTQKANNHTKTKISQVSALVHLPHNITRFSLVWPMGVVV